MFLVYTLVAVLHEFGHAMYAARIGCRLMRLRLFAVRGGGQRGHRGHSHLGRDPSCPGGAVCQCRLCGIVCCALVGFPRNVSVHGHGGVCLAFSGARQPVSRLSAGRRQDRRLHCRAQKGGRVCPPTDAGAGDFVFRLFLRAVCAFFFRNSQFFRLFFALFVLVGTLGARDERYTRLSFDHSKQLSRGMPVRQVAVSGECTVRRGLSFLERGKLLELLVFDEQGELFCVLSQREFLELAKNYPITCTFSQILTEQEYSVWQKI